MKNIKLFMPVAAIICVIIGASVYINFGGKNRVAEIEKGESLTLMVGQEMRIPFGRTYPGLMFAGKLPGESCGRLVAYNKDGIGLWVYEGRRFQVEGMVLLVESINEESITIRLVNS
ncbi:MAG: hypothetical protein ABIK45_09070 [Pseudomonadota bacterium]